MRDRALPILATTPAAPAFAGEEVQNLPAAPAGAPRGGVATGLGGTAPYESGAGVLVAIRRRMT